MGSSAVRQQNAILMAFHWRVDDGPTLNGGLVAFRYFRGFRSVLLGNPVCL